MSLSVSTLRRGPARALIGAAIAWLAVSAAPTSAAQNFGDVKPSPQQVEWQDREFGVIVHFGTNTFMDREWGDGKASPKVFAPTQVDPGQWARASKAAGANYLILVAKHHDGFALWPTAASNYSVKSSPWLDGKGNLVKMTADAVAKEGMGLGIYLSPWDRHEPRYANSKAYDDFYTQQLVELVTGYGEIVEWWLDGAGSAGHVYDFQRYIRELRTYQPNAMVFADVALLDYGDIRWVGNEAGYVRGENWNVIDRHGMLRWRPAEVDTPLYKERWFWHPGADYASRLKTVDELVQTWEQSVGRGGQLVLGIAPDQRGLLPDTDVKRLAEFGEAIKQRYGDSANLAPQAAKKADANQQRAIDNDRSTFWTASDPTHDTLEIDFGQPRTFDRSLVMERLDDGQLVRRYAIEIWENGAWRRVVEAQAIGHTKVDHFKPVTAQRVRLNILSSVGTARIREFKLFAPQS